MKTQKFTFKTIAKKLGLAIITAATITSCTNDATNATPEAYETSNASKNASAFNILTPKAIKGGLVQIEGNVGSKQKELTVLLDGQSLPVIAFNAHKNVTVKLPKNANSSSLEVVTTNQSTSLGILDILENLIPPVFWIENTANGGTKIMQGYRSLYGKNTHKEQLLLSPNQIVSVVNSALTGEVFYAEQAFDAKTFETTSKIIKYDLVDGTSTTLVTTSGLINTIVINKLYDKAFFSLIDNTTFTTSIKEFTLGEHNVTTVLDLGTSSFDAELEYSFLNNSLYYVQNEKNIVQLSLDSKKINTIYDASNFRRIGGLAIDQLGSELFVTDLGTLASQSDIILKGNIDGTASLEKVLIQTAENSPIYNTRSLDYDVLFGYVYWFNSSVNNENNGSIYRAKVNVTPLKAELIFDKLSTGSQIGVSKRGGTKSSNNAKLAL